MRSEVAGSIGKGEASTERLLVCLFLFGLLTGAVVSWVCLFCDNFVRFLFVHFSVYMLYCITLQKSLLKGG